MSPKKQDILQAAGILFAEKGFNETTTAELAQITGSAEGTIFYHFKTKTDLFIATLNAVKEGIVQEFNQYIQKHVFNTGMEMMEKIISFFLYLSMHREEWFKLLERHYPYEFARMNESCRGHLEAIYNTLIDLFESAILIGMKDGSIRELPSKKMAFIVFSMVNGLVWLKHQDIYDTAALYDELLKTCRRILMSDEK